MKTEAQAIQAQGEQQNQWKMPHGLDETRKQHADNLLQKTHDIQSLNADLQHLKAHTNTGDPGTQGKTLGFLPLKECAPKVDEPGRTTYLSFL